MTIVLGIIIGVVMGLTGAGGALVAIPLFLQFLEMGLKEATLYSLIAVIIASLSNFIFQRKFSDYKLSIIFVILSTLGSLATNPFKKLLPDIYMASLLGIVSIYSLYSIWKPKRAGDTKIKTPPWPLTGLIGLCLGGLTTFTGLGGGVLMLPLLIGVYGFDQNRAVATSLLTVALSSLSSLLIQIISGAEFELNVQLLELVVGILLSAFAVKFLITKMHPSHMNKIRNIVFTFVVFLALFKLFS